MKQQQAFAGCRTIKDEFGNLTYETYNGMTLRQYYKAKALQGILSNGGISGHIDGQGRLPDETCSLLAPTSDPMIHATLAGAYADAMIAEDEAHASDITTTEEGAI